MIRFAILMISIGPDNPPIMIPERDNPITIGNLFSADQTSLIYDPNCHPPDAKIEALNIDIIILVINFCLIDKY